MRDKLWGAIPILILCVFLLGVYKIIVDDNRYTSKDVALAVFIPPYPLWVGSKEVYRLATAKPGSQAREDQCFRTAELLGMPRKPRVEFCECTVETNDLDYCRAKLIRAR